MKTHQDNKCSNCGTALDAATSLQDEYSIPNEGDISVCAYCGQMGKYDSEMKITPLREDEIYKLLQDQPELVEPIREIQSVFAFIKHKQNIHPTIKTSN
tara:strand:+ start:375 stop:671 length:297 start_codon:yes stop_codon:yes gene_type:complete